MLDLLFLIGDPKKSVTLIDNPLTHCNYIVGEALPKPRYAQEESKKSKTTPVITNSETRVRIDRTSQLLIAFSITIAEFVKTYCLRSKDTQILEKIRQLSGFEDIVRNTIFDKSGLLTRLLSIEIFFFAKKHNPFK